MNRHTKIRIASVILLTFVLTSGFVCTGSQIHKATVAEHDFKTAVQGFQNVEIAEFQAGHISAAEHQTLETGIAQIANGGSTLVTLLQNSNGAGALTQIDNIDAALQSLLANGVLHVKNQTTAANLQIALQAVQAIVTNIQTLLS